MQLSLFLMSVLTSFIVIGLMFCHVILGSEPQVNFKIRSEEGIVYLTCEIPSSMDIVQVTWQKRRGNSYETLVTNSKKFGNKISKLYENRLSVLKTKDSGTSSIALSQLEKEDGACFMAIFNIYPDGALTGEGCLPKLRGIKEVVCKSSADFSVTLDPPEIKTQHSEPDGTAILIGRWINDDISPVCNFHLRRTARSKRKVKDGDEIFSMECKASGPQKPKITWNNEGRPISREEKENTTGDLITVTSTLHYSLSTLSDEAEISCNIVYNKDPHLSKNVQENDLQNENSYFVRVIILSSAILVILAVVLIYIVYYLNREKSKSQNKADKIEEGVSTPLTKSPHNCYGTPGTETKKRKKGSAGEKNMENIQQNNAESNYSPIGTEENNIGTPVTEIKKRKGSPVKKNKENGPVTTNKVTGKTPRSEKKQENSSQPEAKKKSVKKILFQ
ncbi:OX-2 membrane glycoprotein-like isoform X2 [Phyllobates terribilis]|uniref:OX-2 membrane glycoprotein-like isoform X2 n=1 Tax=Phyllobates terribilis TaxID=111132 RepID=UPI003CCA8887